MSQGKFVDMTGHHYGKLAVIGRSPNRRSVVLWLCKCECGGKAVVRAFNLSHGLTRSCGCLRRETQPNLKHGHSRSGEYKSWMGMRERCYNPKARGYADYGGRGIAMCAEWINDFEKFRTDMGPKPGPEYSIERSNNDLGYSRANCVWATRKQQQGNRRNSRLLTHDGRTQCMGAWATEVGLAHSTLKMRIDVMGWDIAKSLSQPSRKRTNRRQ